MLKLFERHTHETPKERVSEQLPGLPPGIEVPDDLSTLELPRSMHPSRAAAAVRWLRWMPLLALLLAGAVVAAVVLTDDGTSTPATEPTMTAMNTIQEEIDRALADRPTATVLEQVAPRPAVEPSAAEIIQAEIDQAIWLRHASAQEIVQYEIDLALAERQALDEYHTSPAAEIIQAEIDQAIWLRHASAQEIVQYEIDRALAEHQAG